MDSKDKITNDRLNRLLEAARAACPPVAGPSPWFEQRVLQNLREQPPSLVCGFDGMLAFRIFAVAAVVTVVSVVLPFLRPANPYLEAFDETNSVVQLEQVR